MEKWALTDEEITTIGDAWMREDFAVRTVSIGRGHWEEIARAIATAAGEKGYAVGIQDAAAWLRSFNDVSFPVGTYLADTLLAEKGAR